MRQAGKWLLEPLSMVLTPAEECGAYFDAFLTISLAQAAVFLVSAPLPLPLPALTNSATQVAVNSTFNSPLLKALADHPTIPTRHE